MKKPDPKLKRYIWIAIGVIVFAVAMTNVIQQGVAKRRASALLTALQLVLPESTQVSADVLPQGEPEAAVINNKPVIGELLIPSLDVDVAVIGEYSVKDVKTSPCVVSGTVSGRDLIVFGGNYRSHFGGLNTLTPGDTVMFSGMDGNLILYDVETLEFADRETELGVSDGGYALSLYCVTANGTPRYVARCSLCE